MQSIMLMNVKMPTIVDILTFISKIKMTSASLKARKVLIFQHFSFYEQLIFHAQLRMKKKFNLSSRLMGESSKFPKS